MLLAYLPMLLVTVVHVHRAPIADAIVCDDCVHHVAHPMHLGEYVGGETNCLYCHLISMPTLPLSAVAAIIILLPAVRIVANAQGAEVHRRAWRASLRAPPIL